MKQILSLLMAFSLCVSMSLASFADETTPIQDTMPATVSGAYVVMDAESGQILIQKNMDKYKK